MSPTASQEAAAAHETPLDPEVVGPGVLCTVQPLPFHDSASVAEPVPPTASHEATAVQETLLKRSWEAEGLAVVKIFHVVPFHASARVSWAPRFVEYRPTATHALTAAHDTALSDVAVDPAGVGVVSITQVVPFHRSIKGTSPLATVA
jgi:hypothetical protein